MSPDTRNEEQDQDRLEQSAGEMLSSAEQDLCQPEICTRIDCRLPHMIRLVEQVVYALDGLTEEAKPFLDTRQTFREAPRPTFGRSRHDRAEPGEHGEYSKDQQESRQRPG